MTKSIEIVLRTLRYHHGRKLNFRRPRAQPRATYRPLPGALAKAHLAVFVLLLAWPCVATAQLTTLSNGNPGQVWRKSQLQQLKMQLDDSSVQAELREELLSQCKWLQAWKPGELSEKPLWDAPKSIATAGPEPVIDPYRRATDLRARLLAPNANPTTKDTTELQQMLTAYSSDIGVRQLHLHWLDQRQYRKQYPDEIAEAAIRLAGLLEQLEPQTADVKLARAYCFFRRTRALAYRELPDVVSAKPIPDPQAHQAALVGSYRQLVAEVGMGRPEFILVEIRMLKHDQFFGRALSTLTDYASAIEKEWFLKKQRDLLRELKWEFPAREAAGIYAKAFPRQVAEEQAEQARGEALKP